MSATTKFIEDLENPENPLSDNDLLMASVRQGNGYVSRKITLETLAEYVNSRASGESENGSGSGGAVIYDVADENYVWYQPLGVEDIEKTFTKNTRLAIRTPYNGQFLIDNHEININHFQCLSPYDLAWAMIDIKAGQTVRIPKYVPANGLYICCFPLAHGGVFIDTTKSDLFENNTFQPQSPGEWWTKHVDEFTMLHVTYIHSGYSSYIDNGGNNGGNNSYAGVYINGKPVFVPDGTMAQINLHRFYLKPGDEIKFWIPLGQLQNYSAYPIIVDESENGSGDSSGQPEPYINGGLEIYDMSKATATDNTKDYYFDVQLGGNGGNASWSNIIYQDCAVFTRGGNFNDSSSATHWKVTINGKEIEPEWFKDNDSSRTKFYLKKDQTLYIGKYNSTDNPETCYISTFPLSSGGMFFIDTSKIAGNKLESQVVADSSKNNWEYRNDNDYPVAIGVKSSNEYEWLDGSFCKVDGYNAYPQRKGFNSYLWFLNPNQTLQIQNLSVTKYCVFPLLPFDKEIEMDSVQLWENGPYWATRNMGANREEEEGEFFQYGSLVGYKWINSLWQGNGTYDFSFSEQVLPKKSTNPYVYNAQELIDMGWIKQTYDLDTSITNGGTHVSDLTPEHDAATKQLGAGWKIPSVLEWQELINNCDISNDTVKGKTGIRFTGRGQYSNRSIFLPPVGYAYYKDHKYDNSGLGGLSIIYMTSTLCFEGANNHANYAHGFWGRRGTTGAVPSENQEAMGSGAGYANHFVDGLPIRPIKVVS